MSHLSSFLACFLCCSIDTKQSPLLGINNAGRQTSDTDQTQQSTNHTIHMEDTGRERHSKLGLLLGQCSKKKSLSHCHCDTDAPSSSGAGPARPGALVTALLLGRDTMTKAAHYREHLITGLLAVSEGEPLSTWQGACW